MNPSTAAASASPRRSRTWRLGDRVGGCREQLIQDRLGVAHPARGQSRDEGQGGRLHDTAIGLEDPGELALDLGDGQAPHVVALEARQDGGREPGRLGGGEQEEDEVGRLLDRLQERVPGIARDLVGLVEDVDLAAEMPGRIRQPIAQVADLVDAAVGRRVDLEDVERRALADRHAGITRVAGIAVAEVGAVDGLGQDPRERRLAGAARADEQDRVRDPVGADGVAQRLDDGFLPDDLAERLGAPAAIERLVRDGRGHDLLRSSDERGEVAVHPPSIVRNSCPP